MFDFESESVDFSRPLYAADRNLTPREERLLRERRQNEWDRRQHARAQARLDALLAGKRLGLARGARRSLVAA